MTVVFDLGNGICWTLTYITAIILGFKNRTWCIPKLAICMSFSWELLVVINRIQNGSVGGIPFYVQLTWLILDVVILVIWLMFDGGTEKLFQNLCLFFSVFTVMYVFAYRGQAWVLTAFLDNVIMSVLFIYRRTKDHTPWTSRLIAVAKMIGTFSATILEGLIWWNPMILYIGGMCFLLDLYYAATLFSNDSLKSYDQR